MKMIVAYTRWNELEHYADIKGDIFYYVTGSSMYKLQYTYIHRDYIFGRMSDIKGASVPAILWWL